MNDAQEPVVVYRVPLTFTAGQLEQLAVYLCDEERARAARYLVEAPRHQFVGCRAALKILLAHELNLAPQDVRLVIQRWGKPMLHPERIRSRQADSRDAQGAIQFSVSHSADCGLIGLARFPIGVDLEYSQPRLRVASLANMVLSSREQELWNSVPPRQREQQMLRLWVCKEALLKALGLGIAECLQQVSFPIPLPESDVFAPSWIDPAIQVHLEEDANCSRNAWTACSSWAIHALPASHHHLAAVAVGHQSATVQLRDFDWACLGE